MGLGNDSELVIPCLFAFFLSVLGLSVFHLRLPGAGSPQAGETAGEAVAEYVCQLTS